jgi:hypothetical protein
MYDCPDAPEESERKRAPERPGLGYLHTATLAEASYTARHLQALTAPV